MYESGYLPNVASCAYSSQFGYNIRALGTYELEEDAARAYDKVARILGRSDLNFSNSDGLEINGLRSEGADKAVAAAVEDARAFVAAGGNNHTSMYIGVRKQKKCKTNPWQSMIKVRPKTEGASDQHTHKHTHTRLSL